ncbi:MAG: hypothetical protein LBK23_08255 [Oscillospiraceae bacterium]|nr:hypothetical protein [Oscillospiraceae bacterium]
MKKLLLQILIAILVTYCAACNSLPAVDTLPATTISAPQTEYGTLDTETPSNNSDLRQIDDTCWYSGVLGATLDFPDEWEGLFTLETTDVEVIMLMVPPTDYGGMLCFFRRESQSDWIGARGNMPVQIEIVAESADFVIIMTRPGDEQSAPEYREQYYDIADRLGDIVVTFSEDAS